MRKEIEYLASLGPLPSSCATFEEISKWQNGLQNVLAPLDYEELGVLIRLFPPTEDECYGLAWALIHLVETSPLLSAALSATNEASPWISTLQARLDNLSSR